ncbi:hypothetical protein EA462_01840 [Natrarchaeobius halalkaliphilus]|uniref:Uncharacterized protein n=1 Tax=Natrarchaeobius halalkaliphilus TaxID=1679091 RepID=A0A3N6MBX7_9EURY|nr:hypothetical protein EA462_01840 [Natrarchaeobius halalkaliphilus]
MSDERLTLVLDRRFRLERDRSGSKPGLERREFDPSSLPFRLEFSPSDTDCCNDLPLGPQTGRGPTGNGLQ